jgi:WD40 repeat protein
LSDHSGTVWTVCFSNDSSLLVSGSEDNTLKLFSTKNWSKLQDYKENTGPVRCSVFSPDDSIIASGS